MLGLCLKAGHTILAKRWIRESWVMLDRSQIGDDGKVNAVFRVDHIEQAAEYARLYRKQALSDTERERRRETARRLTKHVKNDVSGTVNAI